MNRLFAILFCLFMLNCAPEKTQPESVDIDFVVNYYPDSTVKEIVQRKNKLLEGKAFKFNEDGTKLWEYNYLNDEREGLQYDYVHGKLVFAVPYQDGKQHGWAKRYTGPCGNISEEGQYENGEKNGLWYNYYGAELLEISLFKNDSLIEVVYRNKKYPDRNTPLPPIVMDCNEKWRSGEE